MTRKGRFELLSQEEAKFINCEKGQFDHFSKAMVKQNCEKIANFRAELTLTIDPKTKKKN